jgi:hypothetical protein
MKSLREGDDDKKNRVIMVGASQMGRIGDELRIRQGSKVDVVGAVRMEGENTEKKNMEAVETLSEKADMVDVVVIG